MLRIIALGPCPRLVYLALSAAQIKKNLVVEYKRVRWSVGTRVRNIS